MAKIIFFNHFHRGDLHTNKEFIRQIMQELPDVEFEYMHANPDKLLLDLNIPTVGTPDNLDKNSVFYQDDDTLYVNTWVAANWDLFCKHGGINMHTLYEQWGNIFKTINECFETDIQLKAKEEYLPRIDYSLFEIHNVNTYIESNPDNRKVLICNNVPQSGQSLNSNLSEYIIDAAKKYSDTHFICTNEFHTAGLENILFTSDIVSVEDCDLHEISYLSTFCDAVIGKNSGPYVMCETYENYMDPEKKFLSFNTKHRDYEDIKETMSNGLDIKCKYVTVPIVNTQYPTSEDVKNITKAFNDILV